MTTRKPGGDASPRHAVISVHGENPSGNAPRRLGHLRISIAIVAGILKRELIVFPLSNGQVAAGARGKNPWMTRMAG